MVGNWPYWSVYCFPVISLSIDSLMHLSFKLLIHMLICSFFTSHFIHSFLDASSFYSNLSDFQSAIATQLEPWQERFVRVTLQGNAYVSLVSLEEFVIDAWNSLSDSRLQAAKVNIFYIRESFLQDSSLISSWNKSNSWIFQPFLLLHPPSVIEWVPDPLVSIWYKYVSEEIWIDKLDVPIRFCL